MKPTTLWWSIQISLIHKLARYWELITELNINHFYTTPSVIQKLMSQLKEDQSAHDLPSLRIIASGRTFVSIMVLYAILYIQLENA